MAKDEGISCEGYGTAYSEDDAECQDCDSATECKELMEGSSTEAVGEEEEFAEELAGSDELEEESGFGEGDLDSESATLGARVEALEDRVSVLEGGDKVKKKQPEGLAEEEALEEEAEAPPARKSSKQEKDDKKEALLSKAPYSSTQLGELNGREIKMLASAMGINSFGMSKDACKASILKSQAKGKKKKTAVKKKS